MRYRRRRHRVVAWDRWVTREWPRQIAHLHRSAGGRLLSCESDPVTCFLGDLRDVSNCNQEDVQNIYRSSAEELDVLGCPSQAWLRDQTGCCVAPSDNRSIVQLYRCYRYGQEYASGILCGMIAGCWVLYAIYISQNMLLLLVTLSIPKRRWRCVSVAKHCHSWFSTFIMKRISSAMENKWPRILWWRCGHWRPLSSYLAAWLGRCWEAGSLTPLAGIVRLHRMLAVHRCGLLLQMSHVASCMCVYCVCVCVCVCLSVYWSHGCVMQNWLKR